ncbi:MAG: magnesium chelatase subunit D [Hyphomicrobiales bacterium]|nr:magnesium chelatase subunit D [Hyphomicrobiales bacterium]
MTVAPSTTSVLWSDALLAAAMMAVDPAGLGGIHVRARSGPVRDRWLELAAGIAGRDIPVRRIAAGIAETRLTGGLDLGLTLESGRPVVESGVLAAANGGLVVLAMAERVEASSAAIIGMALDEGAVRIERDGLSKIEPAQFALIALDEGIEDERLAPVLADRLGLRIDLSGVTWPDTHGIAAKLDIGAARLLLPSVVVPDSLIDALCALALSAGVLSMRASLHLVRAARACAALRGVAVAGVEDGSVALRVVLGMAASVPEDAPGPADDAQVDEAPRNEADKEQEELSTEALRDMLVEAVKAELPKHLLAGMETGARSQRQGVAGRAGALRNRARRGRAIGTSDKPPAPGARLDVLATLRNAAPWQRIRAEAAAVGDGRLRKLQIRKSDFRYLRFQEKTGTTAIFAVDASGSAAVERLAETKGAIELLLAECYVRRDQVALISFRGKSSETLLEPTRSLVRAKRSLSALPGGGGTPLASGILATLALAVRSSQKGQSVVAVFLTDGRGNVALDGGTIKSQVLGDMQMAAKAFRANAIRSIVIDTAMRPQARAEVLARDLGAEYLALPRGGARAVAYEIGARMAPP